MHLIAPLQWQETTPSATGNTMKQMRADLKEVVFRRCSVNGDTKLRYVDGLNVFNHSEIAQWTSDQCHPTGDGMYVIHRYHPPVPTFQLNFFAHMQVKVGVS